MLDKYTLFIKRGFDKQQDNVIQLIKNLKKGPMKLKMKDTTHVLCVQENMQNLIRMKFDGAECVDAVIDSDACITGISGRFFDKLNAYRKDRNKLELKKIERTKFSAANSESLHPRGQFKCSMDFTSTIGLNVINVKATIVVLENLRSDCLFGAKDIKGEAMVLAPHLRTVFFTVAFPAVPISMIGATQNPDECMRKMGEVLSNSVHYQKQKNVKFNKVRMEEDMEEED